MAHYDKDKYYLKMKKLFLPKLLATCLIVFGCGQKIETSTDPFLDPFTGDAVIPSVDQAYIDTCLETISEGHTVIIDQKNIGLCVGDKKINTYDQRYVLTKGGQGFSIQLPDLHLVPHPGQTEAEQLRAQDLINNALPCAKNFYSRFSIDLQLNVNFMDEEQESPSEKEQAIVIHYSTQSKRSDSLNYYLGWYSQEQICPLLVHEIGHLLGLPDRYSEEDKCKGRNTVVNNLNVMNNQFARSLDQMGLVDADVKAMIAPICEPRLLSNVKLNVLQEGILFDGDKILTRDEISARYPWTLPYFRIKDFYSKTGIDIRGCAEQGQDFANCNRILNVIQSLEEQGQHKFNKDKRVIFWIWSMPVDQSFEIITSYDSPTISTSGDRRGNDLGLFEQCLTFYSHWPNFSNYCRPQLILNKEATDDEIITAIMTFQLRSDELAEQLKRMLPEIERTKALEVQVSQEWGREIICDSPDHQCEQKIQEILGEGGPKGQKNIPVYLADRQLLPQEESYQLCKEGGKWVISPTSHDWVEDCQDFQLIFY